MHILSIEGFSKSYGEKVLFDDVRFGLAAGDKMGIVGVNGTGKSSLLRAIAGIDPPDRGDIRIGRDMSVRMLEQEPHFAPGETVLAHVLGGQSQAQNAWQEYQLALASLEANSADPKAHDRLDRANAQMDTLNVWQLENDAKMALSKLGITNYDAQISELSGGQRKRVAMAAVLVQPADVLILDEPTNHIDHESVTWLEGMLQKRKGALLMITHDRYFLDRVCNRMMELDRGTAYFYEANYSRFLELKMEREARDAASEAKRQNLLRNELAWIRRGAKARTTKQKARIDRFQELQASGPKAAEGKVDVSVASSRLGRKIMEIEDLHYSNEGQTFIQNFNYIAVPEDRVGIIGRNGVGKSTLLKLITGEWLPNHGQVILGPTVKLGVFRQEHEEMDGNMRVLEYIREGAEQIQTSDGSYISASQMLERFLFNASMQWSTITKLSGGEKRRLQLLRILMSAPNVLLLDEPTNDLDIVTLSVLEEYLDDFPGVVIIVSHDRYFLDRTVERIWSFQGDGVVTQHVGNYTEYEEELQRNASAFGRNNPASAQTLFEKNTQTPPDQKDSDSRKRALRMSWKDEKDFEQIDGWVADAEAELQAIQTEMEAAHADAGKLNELLVKQKAAEEKLEKLIERWTELQELAEEISKQKSKG